MNVSCVNPKAAMNNPHANTNRDTVSFGRKSTFINGEPTCKTVKDDDIIVISKEPLSFLEIDGNAVVYDTCIKHLKVKGGGSIDLQGASRVGRLEIEEKPAFFTNLKKSFLKTSGNSHVENLSINAWTDIITGGESKIDYITANARTILDMHDKTEVKYAAFNNGLVNMSSDSKIGEVSFFKSGKIDTKDNSQAGKVNNWFTIADQFQYLKSTDDET